MSNRCREILFQGNGYTTRLLGVEEMELLQAMCERCKDYYELISGLPPGPGEAQSLFEVLPENKDYSDKFLIGIFKVPQNELVGILDVIRDYPCPHIWYLGLMLLDPLTRGEGIGSSIYKAFEEWAIKSGAEEIKLAVVEENQGAYRFWKRMGFEITEKKIPRRIGAKDVLLIVMKHTLKVQKSYCL